MQAVSQHVFQIASLEDAASADPILVAINQRFHYRMIIKISDEMLNRPGRLGFDYFFNHRNSAAAGEQYCNRIVKP